MTRTSPTPATGAPSATKSRKRTVAPVGAAGAPKPEPKIVAWIGENYDGLAEIVWASTRGQARSLAASELGVGYMEVVSLRRYPALDDFDGDLKSWQLAHGWFFECNGMRCYKRCYGQEEGAPHDPEITTVLDDEGHVFCSPACRDGFEAYWGMHRAIDEAILEDFRKMHPGVEATIRDVGHNEWIGWVHPANHPHTTVWEMVSVHQQHYSRGFP